MRRLLLLISCAGAFACTQQTLPTLARVQGANDLVQAGDLIFVTASDHDELRVLDTVLAKNSTLRDFVRAPNPLDALSIPVVNFPTELTADQGYDADGNDVFGQYVYARGDGVAAISVVPGADKSQLREVRRILTSDPVTAIAARAPPSDGGASTLYFATYDGVKGTLWQVSLPALPGIAEATLAPAQLLSIPGSSVRAIRVLAAANQIAVAIRPPTGSPGSVGWVLNTDTLGQTPLDFPIPVRKLYTHPAVQQVPQGQTPLAATERLYGILDEAYCGDIPAGRTVNNCPGFFVVSAITGAEVLDGAGATMVLDTGGGIPQGLSFGVQAALAGTGGQVIPLLGVFSTSGGRGEPSGGGAPEAAGGQEYFFDAINLRHLAHDPQPTNALLYEDAGGSVRSQVIGGPDANSIVLAAGAAVTENITITYQGFLAPLQDLSFGPDANGNQRLPVGGVATTGDVAVLGPSIAPCSPDLPLTITPDPGGDIAHFPSVEIPSQCPTPVVFSVRAAGVLAPYTVEGAQSGFMGRTGPNSDFAFKNRYFYHVKGFDPNAPAIQFHMGDNDPNILRDYRYVIQVGADYTPEFVYPDPSVFPTYNLPSAVVEDAAISRLFVAYPSTPGVLELDQINMTPGVANGTAVFVEHR